MLKTTGQKKTHDSLFVLLAVVMTFAGAFLLLALVSYAPDQIDGSSPMGSNYCGRIGAHIAHVCIKAWGAVAFYLPLALFGLALAIFRGYRGRDFSLRLAGIILMLPVLCGLVQLLPEFGPVRVLLLHWHCQQLGGLGGALGWFLCGAPDAVGDRVPGHLLRHMDVSGSLVLLLLVGAGSLGLMRLGLTRLAKRIWQEGKDALRRKPTKPLKPISRTRLERPDPTPEQKPTTIEDISRRIASDRDSHEGPDATNLVERIRRRRQELQAENDGTVDGTAAETPPEPPTAESDPILDPIEEAPPELPTTSDGYTGDNQEAEEPAGTTEPPSATRRPASARAGSRLNSDYELPSTGLLEEAERKDENAHAQEKERTARLIEETFREFNIDTRVVRATRGPVITQYELELQAVGFRVSRLEGYEKDLCMRLGTQGIRIVAPLPNKTTVGVEVPNQLQEEVVMKDLIEVIDGEHYALPLVIGRDVIGRPLVGDLAKMPHLLVAGATGMGKSVCMNALICSVLLFRDPGEVRFIMVDPKMVELAGYDGIPHLLTPPITDMTKAHAALEWACQKMDERYYMLRQAGVRNIADFNALGEDALRARLAEHGKDLDDLPGFETHMHYVVILVDEYADLMMVNKEVEKSIVRLTAKSRACGIHIILTTQRPSADIVTGLIKSNLPARISFKVTDRNNSRVVLDCHGAENLLGKGDLLFLQPGTSAPVRGQGVWVKDHEIDAIIDHAKAQGEPVYDDSIFRIGIRAMGGSDNGNDNEWITDRQFHEAVYYIFRHDRTGADFLRRKLNVGYNTATEHVETLERLGFLGPQVGTKARELLCSWEDWLDLLRANDIEPDPDDEIYRNPAG